MSNYCWANADTDVWHQCWIRSVEHGDKHQCECGYEWDVRDGE